MKGRWHSLVELIYHGISARARACLVLACCTFCLPQVNAGEAIHLGVASCASSTCHGSNVEFADSNILHNEFRVWNEQDPHARAFQTLLTPESQKIAGKLGLESAESADDCLHCHAANVPVALRGDAFQIDDGVGCEVCHGAAENYLDSHTTADHQANLRAGLYPTELPEERARLCVSCHVGSNQDRVINHRIMGAGHPRLSFELNTFTSIQPAHYQVDQDYIERKGQISDLQFWAIGQLVAAERILDNIEGFPYSGLFPEFVHMDCLGCHQAMSKINWSRNPVNPLPPGALRYNNSHLMMSYQLALAIAPETAHELLENIRLFSGTGSSLNNLDRILPELRQNLAKLKANLQQKPIVAAQGLAILDALLDIGLVSSYRDYSAAEQSAMAINSVLKVIDADRTLSVERATLLRGLESIFNGLDDAEHYQPDVFVAGLKRIKSALPRIQPTGEG
ncbi:MAG: hypothetical protein HKN85_03555 [Gammaproteobacteria bacterium]|nr:hypothetical protein [Gammaproteobacteria bacterium]